MIEICNSTFKDEAYQSDFDKYPFPLSDFQKWAIKGIKTDKNVLITAHTGSGKTLPAENAINHFVSLNKKIIYCSPLKALSNEKFNDFTHKFPHITFGILTGDIKFNPDADVLIMTTEILRNNLFQMKEGVVENTNMTLDFEMDIKNELACVIYDEIHYINDVDRGHVWEESIMLLPETTQIMGLSATIQNPEKLCNLLHQSNKKPVYLCSNKKRVVPLIHHVYYAIPENAKKKLKDKTLKLIEGTVNKPIVLKQDNTFNDEAVHTIKKVDEALFQYKNVKVNKHFIMNNMVEYLKTHDLLPGIVFVFSRKQCYDYAKKITIPLFENNENMASIIKKECKEILIKKLSNWNEYINLKEYVELVSMLEKGIAVHHSGVTPIFREMIELLFKKGYVRLLFATETFAVGINMPTRSVVFTALKKYTQGGYRCLFPHEYTQMAGRAGRRGIDTVGYIFHLNNFYINKNTVNVDEYRHIVNGNSQEIQSRISITPSMILRYLYTTNRCNIDEYLKNSMIYDETLKQQNYLKLKQQQLMKHYDACEAELENYTFKTSYESAVDFYNYMNESTNCLNATVSQSVIKRYRKTVKKWGEKNLEQDANVIIKFKKAESQLIKLDECIIPHEYYFRKDLETQVDILLKNQFLEGNRVDFKLTTKGMIASIVQEMPGLAIAEYFTQHLDYISNLSPIELVVILSIFTNIRVSDDDCVYDPTILEIPYVCKKNVDMIKNYLNKYLDIEIFYCNSLAKKYEIQYNICETVYKWCNASSEEECINVFNELAHWGIFLGDFVKAILKINNIVNELEKVAELTENMQLLSVLTKIPKITLKSVVTNNSLYL